MINTIHVAAAVITNGTSYLAGMRKQGKSMAGKWEFPGGKLEQGETADQALIREIHEELSVDIVVKKHLTTVSHGTITLHAFFAEIIKGTADCSTDHDELRWIKPEDLCTYDFCTADTQIIKHLVNL